MLALFGSTSFLRADELTIHDGTATNSYVPVYGFYADAFLKCEMVIPADELTAMDGGVINSMKFYSSTSSASWGAASFQVFMTEIDDATISAFNGPGNIVCEEASLSIVNGEMDVVFDTPYHYNGGNLLVGVYNTVKGSYVSCTWLGETVNGASVQGYSYDAVSAVSPSQRNFLPKTTFVYEAGAPVPPIPTGELVITPETFALGYKPVNGWTEPLAVSIINGAEPATITAVISNTAGNNPFTMSQEINGITLETGETIDFTVDINRNAAVGEYAEEFTMFSVTNAKDITTVPVTATFYTAGPADIVETAENIALSYTSGVANFSKTPTDLHANYFGYNNVTSLDAVYVLNITKDSRFTVNGGTFIGIYNKVSDFHPTVSIQPVLHSYNGSITEEILLAGQYYMIVSGDNITTIEGTVEQMPAPGALTNLAPADQMTGVEAPVVLTWEGGENAAEYQVLFGTSPIYMLPVLDWTIVDDNYGSFDVSELIENNTQYFWRINARNSNGTVTGGTWGFTSTLTTPNTVTASEEEIFTDGTTLIRWKHSSGAMGNLDETQIGSGTSTSGYFPTYNLYNYSLTEQIYTSDELGGTAGYINSISFYPVGSITRNLQVYIANTDKESFGGGSDWVAMTDDNLVYSGNVAMVANTWVTVTFDEPFAYEGGNIILAVNDLTGTWTSSVSYYVFDATAQAINVYQDSAPYSATAPSATGTVRAFKNQIIINKDGAKGATANRSFMYYNVYYGDVKANAEPIYEKQYLLGNLPYNVEPGHNVSVTAVYDEGESALSNPVVVKVSGYGTFTGTVTELISGEPVAGVTVKFNGKDEFNNNVSFEGTTNNNGVYTITAKAGTYVGVASLEGMEPNYSANVTLAYDGTETVDFVIHEVYKPVMSVLATEVDPTLAKVQWSVNYAISGGGISGAGDTFTEDFESGSLPTGWATIDADGDGYNWGMVSDFSGTGHNSNNAVYSASYINYVGALNPDNYLVTSQVTPVAGSTFSFWACAQDASYAAEHFGVAVSTGSQTNASDFTTIQEWTMTAKGSGVMAPGRDGETRAQGNWYQYSVDLSSYAGQAIYIAIRHFNCSDWFYLDVDDVAFTTSAKSNRDMWDLVYEFDATSGYQYGVASDGTNIYTSSWSANSTSMFYKYDMEGNFIEEFNISGCGQLRGMTYDGQYFYGVANAATIYCVDLANHTLVSTITSAYGAMRAITYDPVRDGFWVVGNWSGNLTLVDRTGAIVQAGPAPTSASDVAYYKDTDNVEHIFCFNNGDNGVYDYNITTNTLATSAVFNFNNNPLVTGSTGGCFVGTYDNKTCFFGDIQQSPQHIAIYELDSESVPPVPSGDILGAFIFRDGELLTPAPIAAQTFVDNNVGEGEHEYCIRVVYSDYAMSCSECLTVEIGAQACDPVTNLVGEEYHNEYDGILLEWDAPAGAISYNIYQIVSGTPYLLGNTPENGVIITDVPVGTYTLGVTAVYTACESDMVTVTVTYTNVEENEIVNAIYPNPTSGDLHINATAMTRVSVYNAMGQMVYDQAIDGDETVINMGQFEAGVYMVNIVTENGSTVKRITVVK